jgi:hypothetical protein
MPGTVRPKECQAIARRIRVPIILLLLMIISVTMGRRSVAQEGLTVPDTSRPAIIRITSIPDSAAVVINDTVVGITPFMRIAPAGKELLVRVTCYGFQDWSVSTRAPGGDTTTLAIVLERIVPTVTVVAGDRGRAVRLDGKEISRGSIYSQPLTMGPHEIEVTDSSSGHSVSARLPLTRPLQYFFSAKFGVVRTSRVLGTLFVPGAVQISDGDYIKGGALFAGGVVLGYLAVQAHLEHADRLREYDAALDRYILAPTDVEATHRHEDVVQRKDDLDRAYARRTAFVALFGACYLYSLIDGLLHHITGDTFDIISPRDIPGLAFPPDAQGASVRVKL